MNYKTVHILLFGTGNVGNTFIQQFKESVEFIKNSSGIKLKLIGIANSQKCWFQKDGLTDSEEALVLLENYEISEVINLVKSHNLENLIAIDATASKELSDNYPYLINNGFHIVAANKIANTNSHAEYRNLRDVLKENNKIFKYETNVGAGLPVIETIKTLYESGDQVTKIRGVFSGSLSYIFNTFCQETVSFSAVVKKALRLGYTEPDPRIDLSGKDVARKLLILAREIGLSFEFDQIKIKSLLIPSLENNTSKNWFLRNMSELDKPFETAKITQKPNHVLRYIGELDVHNKTLEVKLISTPENSTLGQLTGADTIFEIFTTSYRQTPLVIRGAGAGKEVTARGVLSDVIKISKELKHLKMANAS